MRFNTNSEKGAGLKVVIRALSHRNYRLFFSGQSISLIGTWMQRTAMSWLVYRLTNSALLLGLIGFVGQIPIFLFTPFAGVLADRLNRRRILIATQTLAMIQAFILAFLVLTDMVAVWHLILLNIFLGFVDSVDTPVRQSFVIEMVERREDLVNAIALNSSMVNSAQLIGPSMAGLMIGAMGEGMCFLLNALSYLAVIASLFAMKMTSKQIESSRTRILEGLKEGVCYAFGFRPIRFLLMLIALVSLMGIPYMVLMPIFARDILHGGPHTLGFLMGSTGVGALVGGAYLASRKPSLV
jgi:MFS family permease